MTHSKGPVEPWDLYAAAALQGLCSVRNQPVGEHTRQAASLADALLAERAKRACTAFDGMGRCMLLKGHDGLHSRSYLPVYFGDEAAQPDATEDQLCAGATVQAPAQDGGSPSESDVRSAKNWFAIILAGKATELDLATAFMLRGGVGYSEGIRATLRNVREGKAEQTAADAVDLSEQLKASTDAMLRAAGLQHAKPPEPNPFLESAVAAGIVSRSYTADPRDAEQAASEEQWEAALAKARSEGYRAGELAMRERATHECGDYVGRVRKLAAEPSRDSPRQAEMTLRAEAAGACVTLIAGLRPNGGGA